MNKILLCISLITIFNTSVAQVPDLVFIGTVTLKDGPVYTYKLQFSDSAEILKGYSVTDVMGENETKTAIKGTIDAAKKQISYTETRILFTKSTSEKNDFCYIHARLKISKTKGATTLKGHFNGYKEDGKTLCAEGKILLFNAKDVLDKLIKIAGKDSLAKPYMDTVKKTENIVEVTYEKEVPESEISKVTPGKTIEIVCPDPLVTLEVWDAETIDGDIISLLEGKKTLLENYMISGRRKELTINMNNRQTDTLTLIAISEGTEPTNTARIKLTSGKTSDYIDATTTVDKKVTIILKQRLQGMLIK